MFSSKFSQQRLVVALGAIALVSLLPACKDAEIEKRLARMEEKVGLSATPAPSPGAERSGGGPASTAAFSGGCVGKVEGVVATVGLLRKMETAMQGYAPAAPPVVDDRDQFRCVTEAQLQTDGELKRQAQKVVAALQASQAKRRKSQEQGFEIAYTYAPDYGSMKTEVTSAGCVSGVRGSADSSITQSDCSGLGNLGYPTRWQPAETKQTYPDGPPELMRRMTASQLAVPEELHCLVKDVAATGLVECEGGGEVQYAVWFDRSKTSTINRGDLVTTTSVQVRKSGPTSPWVLGKKDQPSAKVAERSTCCPARR